MCGSDGCNRRLFTLEISDQDERVHGGRCGTRGNTGNVTFGRTSHLDERHIGNIDLYAGTINQGRACVYNTGTMYNIRKGNDIW